MESHKSHKSQNPLLILSLISLTPGGVKTETETESVKRVSKLKRRATESQGRDGRCECDICVERAYNSLTTIKSHKSLIINELQESPWKFQSAGLLTTPTKHAVCKNSISAQRV